MSKKITLIVLAFFASIFLVACGKSPDVTANANGTKIGDTIKIGVNMELTGAVAAYGKAEQNGIKLAVDEINKAGGVDGKKLELVTKDLQVRRMTLRKIPKVRRNSFSVQPLKIATKVKFWQLILTII